MISLLLLAIVLFIAAIALLINAFILWDSENVVRSVSPNSTTTHINTWAIISLILSIILFAICLWVFWEYYKVGAKPNKYKKTSVVNTKLQI